MTGMTGTIGWAVQWMENGRRVYRSGWNSKDMWIAIQVPDEELTMTEPYVYMKTAQGGMIPWLCSQADLLASDWRLIGKR